MTASTTRRGTTNRNARGNTTDRARRRAWLVETFRADVDIYHGLHSAEMEVSRPLGTGCPACRCYRCGTLLDEDTVTVDRIIPGVKGGTYRRNNIRPACGDCNSETGARLGNARRSA